jgi:hypothetical protein
MLVKILKIIAIFIVLFISCSVVVPECNNCFSPYGSNWREQSNKLAPELNRSKQEQSNIIKILKDLNKSQ